MNRPHHAAMTGIVLLNCLAPAASHAQASVKYYRRALCSNSPAREFVEEVGPTATGTFFRVERDESGSITREVRLRNGRPTGEWIYEHAGTGNLPTGYRYLESGEVKGITRLTRNTKGQVTFEENWTASRTFTGWSTLDYFGDTVVRTRSFATDGTETDRTDSFYSKNGLLVRSIDYADMPDSARRMISQIDAATCRTIVNVQMNGADTTILSRYSFNADGDMIRTDAYRRDGSLYAADEYTDNLKTRRLYTTGREVQYRYDGSRTLTASEVWFGGHLVVRLTYDRLPDFTVKRSLATGPNGDLWAEYPNQLVTDVGQDGKTVTGMEATIYKTGPWW